jgi:hypothetical protein
MHSVLPGLSGCNLEYGETTTEHSTNIRYTIVLKKEYISALAMFSVPHMNQESVYNTISKILPISQPTWDVCKSTAAVVKDAMYRTPRTAS